MKWWRSSRPACWLWRRSPSWDTGSRPSGRVIGIGFLVGKALESMARQPEAANNVRTNMFIGIGFVEALALFGFVLAFIAK